MHSSELLSDQQIKFFRTFGFLSFPGLLQDRLESIVDAFEEQFEMCGGHYGNGHDGTARSCLHPFIDRSEYLSTLVDDPRLDGIAASLLGADYNYMGSDGNFCVGDTSWHRDGCQDREVRYIKVAMYLDPVAKDTGSLRVIPGSHHLNDAYAGGLNANVHNPQGSLGVAGADVPALALETNPGDVLCFDYNTFHASFGGGKRRRMFSLNFSQRYPEERLGDLRDYIATYARFWTDRMLGETMIDTAGPGRMKHLEQVMANDLHLAELSRIARETMKEPARG